MQPTPWRKGLLTALQDGGDIQSLAESQALELVEAEAATRTSAELDATSGSRCS